jgi:hypothetical protein
MGRKRICKGCGQELMKLQEGFLRNGQLVPNENPPRWFHRNLGACKETLLKKTKPNRKKVSK